MKKRYVVPLTEVTEMKMTGLLCYSGGSIDIYTGGEGSISDLDFGGLDDIGLGGGDADYTGDIR